MKRMWSKNELKEIVKGTQGYNFANLVDAEGHPRFIEGNITIGEKEGVSQLYGKWSLSGSHLMIVICFTIANGTALSGGLADINLPKWILDKIVPITSNVVEYKAVATFDSSINSQNMSTALRKATAKLTLECGITATADRTARYTCDLLIDNE